MKYLVIAACLATVAFARPDGAGHDHSHSHGDASAPSSGYAQPSSGYGAASSTGYAAPSGSGTGYQAADTSYSGYEASSGYAATGTGYDQSYAAETGAGYGSSGYDTSYESTDAGFPNLSVIIIPLLIAAGIFLLFPQTTQVAVRRKRSAEDEVAGNTVMERVSDIYNSIMESEECMERVACELGGLVQDFGVNTSLVSSAQKLVPGKYSKYMKKFSTGKDCHKIKCGNFF